MAPPPGAASGSSPAWPPPARREGIELRRAQPLLHHGPVRPWRELRAARAGAAPPCEVTRPDRRSRRPSPRGSNGRALVASDGLTPDGFTPPPAAKSCGALRAAAGGLQVHALAAKLGLGDNPFVDNSLVSMYGRCGRGEDADKVFDGMPTRNLVSWNALMSVISDAGLPRRGVELEVSNVLVDMYAKCGEVADAERTFLEASERNVVSWNVMLSGYARNGEATAAFGLLQEMQMGHGVPAVEITMLSVLPVCFC